MDDNKNINPNKDNDKKFRTWDNSTEENINESVESDSETIEYFTE